MTGFTRNAVGHNATMECLIAAYTSSGWRRKFAHSWTMQRMILRMSRFLQWFFQNRETGAVTIAQRPNLVLWIAIVGSVLIWAWHPGGHLGVALEIVVKFAIFVWAIDEVWRGVNPWRRCLGAAVMGYELAAML